MKKVRAIKVWTDGFNAINQQVEDFLVLYEFFEAKEATEAVNRARALINRIEQEMR